MKVQIRNGIFETNSSSTHAIVIPTEFDTSMANGERVGFSSDYEFGWEWDIHYSPNAKAAYFWIAALDRIGRCRSVEELKAKVEELKEKIVCILIKYGVECEFEDIKYTESSWDKGFYFPDIEGYIDHCTQAEYLVDELLNDPDLFITYLFSNAYITTGNDNDDIELEVPTDESKYKIYYKGN